MNKLQLLKTFQSLGEPNDNKSATAYTVYLDLLECQILVDYFYDADIQSIYFKQKLNDNKIDFIIPMTVNENINLLRLHQIRTKLCDDNSALGMVVAVVCANGAIIYHRFSDGKVLDFRLKN
ncbi:uncharacterized protein LOC119080603 [Bradysia coprophila]|uniref:uncharacterized protein LOC119080603 n=1 Tax=Bradysia coprophila TaxID=38358 RepID=UPI00187D8C1B|nr:uncharacterized protein LOC119080603 [Bradysia coprophila]